MEAVVETTKWSDNPNAVNHTYLLDGMKMIAYLKFGEGKPHYFSKPITIDKRGRTFKVLSINPFKKVKEKSTVIKITGSKGNIYSIDTEEKSCTCPGYTYRGTCKHITELLNG